MKNTKRIAILFWLLVAMISITSCRKQTESIDNQMINSNNQVGVKHNEGLAYVLNELMNAKETGNLVIDLRLEGDPLLLARQSIESYIEMEFNNSMEDQLIALACSDDIFNRVLDIEDYQNTWFQEDDTRLSSKQKELLNCLKNILSQDYDLDTTLLYFDNVLQRVSQECNDEEARLMYYAIYIGKASCNYWHDHIDDWCQLFDANRGWFNWKDLIGNDIGGAVGGAIGGAIGGGAAGAAAGAVGGAIGGSVCSAIVQTVNHYF